MHVLFVVWKMAVVAGRRKELVICTKLEHSHMMFIRCSVECESVALTFFTQVGSVMCNGVQVHGARLAERVVVN